MLHLNCPNCIRENGPEHATIPPTCILVDHGPGLYACEHCAWSFTIKNENGAMVITKEHPLGSSALGEDGRVRSRD